METRGAESLLDLPSIIPPNFPTPRGAGNPQSDGNTEIPSPTLSTRNSTLVPTNGTEDPLPVPVDDRPILHNMSAKNKTKTFAGETNMATTRDNDVDNSTKLPQANPLLGLVLETRPIISDVTADNRPEQPLGFKAARDRLDGNESYMVVNHAQKTPP